MRREKYGGRIKGTQNKATIALKERFTALLDEVSPEQLKKDLMRLDSKERLDIVIKLAEYFIPKLNRIQVTGNESNPIKMNVQWLGSKAKDFEQPDISKFSTEDLQIINEIYSKYEGETV